jgi:RNA polymerase I-specific transcription initiation factor RRN3
MGLAVSEVTTHGVGETEVSDEDLIAIARSWILRALASASSRGDKGHYNKLLSDLRDPRINDIASVSALSIRLTALSQTVSYFDEHDHQTLLMYLLGMSVWIYSDEVVDSLLSFVVNLATVNGSYVSQCSDMLVRNFLPPSCCLPAFLDSFSRSGLMMGFLSMDKLRTQALEHIVRKDAVSLSLYTAHVCS